MRAAGTYANLYHRGLLISDADILIAASALEHGLAVTTHNSSHFQRMPDLVVEDWLL